VLDPASSVATDSAGTGLTAVRAPVRSKASGWLHQPIVLRVLSLVVVLGLWQLLGTGRPYTITTPSAIVSSAAADMTSQVLPAFGSTLDAFGLGYLLCVVVGVPVGLLMARSRLVELALRPYVSALFATPRVALIPVVMLWAGLGFELQLVVAVMFGIFPIILNVYIGVKEVKQEHIDVGVAFDAGNARILWTIIIPGSLHYIFAGLRIGLGYAMIGTVVAEIEASVVGVGNLMRLDGQELNIAAMWVPLIMLGLFSICVTMLLKWAERWLSMPWTRTLKRARWQSPS
jgi:ABC-type nitrate/sulfonate/bicarbonate transport system permease component